MQLKQLKQRALATLLAVVLVQTLLGVPAQAKKKQSTPRVDYSGVFLDAGSRAALRSTLLPQLFPTPLDRRYLDHMTIDFAPSAAQVAATPVGASAQLKVIGYAGDKRVQALVVQPLSPTGLRSSNPIPHVTVATHNAAPVEANALVQRGYTPLANGPVISGRVGLASRGKILYQK